MQDSNWSLDTTFKNYEEKDIAQPSSPEESVDRYGARTALLVLCISLFIAALWIMSRPSFEKCSVIENAPDRHACYDELRDDLLKPPAKGGNIRY